jgi:hypothetical protein
MDKQEQIDLIATKIYGWKLGYDDEIPVYLNEDNQPFLNRAHFRPDTSVVQAIEALKQYCKDNKVYWCLGWTSPYDDAICSIQNKDGSIIAQAKHLKDSEAICLCLIEAIGGKG